MPIILFPLFLILPLWCSAKDTPSAAAAPATKPMDEPSRIIRHNDWVRITLKYPGRSIGSLEKVQKNGEVATPDGSMVRAAALSLSALRTHLMALYAGVPGHETVEISVSIASSPYSVVKDEAPTRSKDGGKPLATVTVKPPSVFPRVFKSPLTVWEAIQLEGGIPPGVASRQIRILKTDMTRKTLDCSGKAGSPDGNTLVESGDYLFLIADDVPVSKIFE